MYRAKNGKIVVESIFDYIGICGLRTILKKQGYRVYCDFFVLPTIFVKDYYLPKGVWYL